MWFIGIKLLLQKDSVSPDGSRSFLKLLPVLSPTEKKGLTSCHKKILLYFSGW
jgi:hypothetical protein